VDNVLDIPLPSPVLHGRGGVRRTETLIECGGDGFKVSSLLELRGQELAFRR